MSSEFPTTTTSLRQDHRLQPQRFELKYLIAPGLVAPLRDFVSCHLELDDFSARRPNQSYPIHSIYLDSDDLQTHRAWLNGTKNRFKLRLRFYDEGADTPVFCEVKRRVDNAIMKQRCPVRRAAVAGLLAGQMPEPDQIAAPDPRHYAALERFILLAQRLNAAPRLHNAYLREAWVRPQDNSVRVTFDREIRAEPCFSGATTATMAQPRSLHREFVVLELKFTTRFPNWLRELVERFSLMQCSSAKYSSAIEMLGQHRFGNGHARQGAQPEAARSSAEIQRGTQPVDFEVCTQARMADFHRDAGASYRTPNRQQDPLRIEEEVGERREIC
jgi:hypothetical protein